MAGRSPALCGQSLEVESILRYVRRRYAPTQPKQTKNTAVVIWSRYRVGERRREPEFADIRAETHWGRWFELQFLTFPTLHKDCILYFWVCCTYPCHYVLYSPHPNMIHPNMIHSTICLCFLGHLSHQLLARKMKI